MHAVPAGIEQAFDEKQAVGQSPDAGQGQAGARHVDRQAQVAAAFEQLAGHAAHDFPVGGNGRGDRLAVLHFGLAERFLFEGEKCRVIFQVGPAGRVGIDLQQQGVDIDNAHPHSGNM